MMYNKNSSLTGSILTSTAVGALIGAVIGGISLMCRDNSSNCSCMKSSAHSVLKRAEHAMRNLRKSI